MGREGSNQFENFTKADGSAIFRCMAIEFFYKPSFLQITCFPGGIEMEYWFKMG